jgi:hypothetical protein
MYEQNILWKWCLVNDLISENKMLFTYEEFMNLYNIRLNFIEYFSILSAIPHRWKCKYIPKQFMLNVKMPPLNIQSKMEKGSSFRDCYWKLEFHLRL